MADERDDIDLVIEADEKKPEDDLIVEAADAGKKAGAETEPELVLDDLKAQLDAEKAGREQERSARLAAEAEAQRHAQAATAAKTEVQDTNVQLVTNAVASLKAAQEAAEDRYADALVTQDYKLAAKIQTEMAGNAAKLHTLETGLESLKAQPKPKEPELSGDPVEKLAAQLTPRSGAWVRAHPDYATDQRLYQRMIAAHNLAVTDSLAPDTDAYFEHVEKTLGLRRAEEGQEQRQERQQRPAAPSPAPVGRAGTNGSRPNTVRLSAEEREMAQMMGMTELDYARNKLALQTEGKIH